jgi:hypothetical protein
MKNNEKGEPLDNQKIGFIYLHAIKNHMAFPEEAHVKKFTQLIP